MVSEDMARLDDLDLALIRELESDARQSCPDLGRKLGTSSTTVYRRLHKLLNNRTIDIVAIVDPLALGYHVRAGIGINIHAGHTNSAVQQMAALGAIQHIIVTTGRYDVIAWGVFRSYEELLDFVSSSVGAIPDVANTEIMLVLKSVKSSWAYLECDDYLVAGAGITCAVDDLDLALIGEMETDPRQTVTDVSKKLGISISSASRKLQSLFDDGIIRVVSIPNRSFLGYNVRAVTLVKVHPGKIHTVAAEVARDRNVTQVAIVSGAFDLFVSGYYRDIKGMYEFLNSKLSPIPGIMRYETLIHVKIAKRSFSLLGH